jgi:hypothetical protein
MLFSLPIFGNIKLPSTTAAQLFASFLRVYAWNNQSHAMRAQDYGGVINSVQTEDTEF